MKMSPTEAPARPLNPCELEVDLFCKGARVAPSCTLEEDARHVARTRAGLGSGLEIVVPGWYKDIWLNVPIEEDFAADSPYRLEKSAAGPYHVLDTRSGFEYNVRIPPEPRWYTQK